MSRIRSRRDVAQLKNRPFSGSHQLDFGVVRIIVPQQMQQTVHDVQHEFLRGTETTLVRSVQCRFGANDDFAIDSLSATAGKLDRGFYCVILLTVEQKANHVGGIVVLEVAFIHLVDRHVIDQRDTDFGTDRLFGGKCFCDDIVQQGLIDFEQRLVVCDVDFVHGFGASDAIADDAESGGQFGFVLSSRSLFGVLNPSVVNADERFGERVLNGFDFGKRQ